MKHSLTTSTAKASRVCAILYPIQDEFLIAKKTAITVLTMGNGKEFQSKATNYARSTVDHMHEHGILSAYKRHMTSLKKLYIYSIYHCMFQSI